MTTSSTPATRSPSALLRGQIVRVPFPFTNQLGTKTRPACVISTPTYNAGPDFVVAMVTSSARFLRQPGLGDVVISDLKSAGLRLPSVVRAGRVLVVEHPLLLRVLGRLAPPDLAKVDQALRAVFDLF